MSAQRKSMQKFMFDRSFDDPNKLYLPGEKRRAEREAEEAAMALAAAAARQNADMPATVEDVEAAPPPPETKFTQGHLDAAREDGYVAGHAAALEEAATAREHYVADALALVSQGLAKLDEKQAAANREMGETVMRMVYALVRKLIPVEAEQQAVANVGSFVAKVLPLVIGEPKLMVRVHSSIVPLVEERLKETFARASFQGGCSVIADFELQPGDCRLDWSGGGADRNEGRIWAEIREVIAANYGDVDSEALDRAADTEAAKLKLEQDNGGQTNG